MVGCAGLVFVLILAPMGPVNLKPLADGFIALCGLCLALVVGIIVLSVLLLVGCTPESAPITPADLTEAERDCLGDSATLTWLQFSACEARKDRAGYCSTDAISDREEKRNLECVQ